MHWYVTLTYRGDLGEQHVVELAVDRLIDLLRHRGGVATVGSDTIALTVWSEHDDMGVALRRGESDIDEAIEAVGFGHLLQVRGEAALVGGATV